ncbi:MAG: aromatic ring-hydroxylating dioxygenase subunit alpha, partial [Pseudomonadota bacterium]|nr:aromatic ring-hydroxylating dioxygenase subunit alpha [Pseudomonadota bacterium]
MNLSPAIAHDPSSAAAPIASATGLPNWFYADREALAAEKQAVFAPGWAGIGFAKDVPLAGDVKPVTFLGEPLLLVRDREGAVRVFQNACRHRGVALVGKAQSTTGLLRCPYHAWCYDLKGVLRQTPHVGGPGIHEHASVDKSKLGLVEIRSHVFLDVVFVNLSGDAEPFEIAFGSMLERWRDFDRPVHHGGPDSSFSLDVATNWKLAVENYCESYHLPFIHPGLNSYSRLEDHANILGDGPWSGQLTRVYNPGLDAAGRRFTDFEGIDPRWSTNAEYLALYPNVLMGVHRDHTFAIVIEPV